MIILSLETSTVASSVAIASEDSILAEISAKTRFTHSKTLVPHMEKALLLAGVKRENLGAVAVSIGPGSFTGLRIGLSAAKAVSYALSIPLVGISTLEALAAAFPTPGAKIAAVIDAQKGNAYFALYERTVDGLFEKRGISVASRGDILAAIKGEGGIVTLAGDFARRLFDEAKVVPGNAKLAPLTHMMPRASCVAARAFARIKKGDVDNPMTLTPVYIRKSEAEVLWEKRQGKVAL